MPRIVSFLIFFTVVIAIVSAMHYYVWARIVRDTALSPPLKDSGTYLMIALGILFPISLILSRSFSSQFSYIILWCTYLWLGMIMLFVFFFLFSDLLKLLIHIFSWLSSSGNSTMNPERRVFLSRTMAGSGLAMVFAATGRGVQQYFQTAVVKQVPLTFNHLPDVFKGYKIVQISDLHLGQMMTRATLAGIVDQVNQLKPDLVLITGDLVDGSIKHLHGSVAPLKHLEARKGVYFVTGNHEYYSGVQYWLPHIESLGIKVLNNETVKIKEQDAFFYLSGVPDKESKNFGQKFAADFQKTFTGLKEDSIKILMAHQPIDVKKASQYHVDLVLSGHTHGGQIWPFNYLVYLQQPYLKGLYRYKNTQLYVNQGTGSWGPPMRLGSVNEITEIILT